MRIQTIANGDLFWLNLEKPTREIVETELTVRGYLFYELDIEECLSKRHISKIANYLLILFVRHLEDSICKGDMSS